MWEYGDLVEPRLKRKRRIREHVTENKLKKKPESFQPNPKLLSGNLLVNNKRK